MENRSFEPAGNEELRLVLLGRTGSGKSASGNTILGRRAFLSQPSPSSVTEVCQVGTAELTEDEDGQRRTRRVTVIDTPGYGDTSLDEEQIRTETAKCVSLSAPGPHAFLLVVPIGRYTASENQAVCELARMFGEDAVRHHTVVLLTRGDDLEGLEIEEYLRKAPAGLRSVIERCGGRYHVFNNRDPSNTQQVEELLRKVDDMASETKEGFYTNAMFLEVEAAIREEERRMLREQERHEKNGVKDRLVAKRRKGDLESDCSRQKTRRRRKRDLGRGDVEGVGVERWSEERSGSGQPSPNPRRMAALSPNVLEKIKILLAAAATGLAVGALIGVAVPLAAAGGAYLSGMCAGAVNAAAANSVGAVVAAASGKTALAVGAAAGAFIGTSVGVVVGLEAASPREAALDTLKQGGVIGASAVGVAACVGLTVGAAAAVNAAAVGAAPVGAASGSVAAGSSSAAGPGALSVGSVETTAQVLKGVVVGAGKAAGAAAGAVLAAGLTLKMVKEKATVCTGTRNLERTTYEFHLNK